MTITHQDPVVDQFNSLPASCRRGGGRSHVTYWRADAPSPLTDPTGTRVTFRAAQTAPVVNFGRKRLTFSFRSARTGTVQQGEGPWELLLAKYLETTPSVHAYSLHAHRAMLTSPDGIATYGPDAVWAEVDGSVTCAEVKASSSYFSQPTTAAMLDVVEKGLTAGGIRFARITGDALQADRRRHFNVCRAFMDGLGSFDDRLASRAREVLANGPVALGRLGELLGVSGTYRLRVVNALMVRHVAAYDLSAAVTPDLAVSDAPTRNVVRDLSGLVV
jgi:hypothetical protein